MAVRVGFLGCGGIAGAHMQYLSRILDAEMTAFCDTDESRAQAAAQARGGRAYTDFARMLDAEKLGALFVCLPPHAHTDQEVMAAERGIHLFVEKPVARTLGKAKEIEAAIARSEVISSVGYVMRYYDTTQRARELLDGRTIGMVLAFRMGGLPGTPWWRVMAESGGQLVEQATHEVDLMRYLAGDIRRVYAAHALRAMGGVPNLDIPDVGAIALEFASGAVGLLSTTCMLSQGYKGGTRVICKDLVVECGGALRVIEPQSTCEYRMRNDGMADEDRIFIEAVMTGDRSKILSPYADGVKTLAVTLAANESAERGEPVEVRD